MRVAACLTAVSILLFVGAFPVYAQQDFDGLVSGPAVAALQDKPMKVILRTGLELDDAVFSGLILDAKTSGVKFVEYKRGRKSTKTKPEDIYRIEIANKPYSLRYHGPSKSFHLIDETAARTIIQTRLTGMKCKLYEQPDREQLKELNQANLKFISDGVDKIASPGLRVEETEHAFIVTDFPAPIVRAFAQYIPKAIQLMNQQFGLPPNATVLPGKPILVLVKTREHFTAFESQVLDNKNFGTNRQYFRVSGERFILTKQTDELSEGTWTAVCWGFAGAYNDRAYSSVDFPRWVTVGLRSVITEGTSKPTPNRDKGELEALKRELKRDGSLNEILTAEEIQDSRQYITKYLVKFLIARDPQATSQYLLDLKAGHEPERALETNFGIDNIGFAKQFGLALGFPNISP